MTRFAITVLALSLSGCATMGYGDMSATQIAAAAKDKSATAYCVTVTGMGGQVQSLYINTDKGTVTSGRSTLKCGNAEATFEDAGKPAVK